MSDSTVIRRDLITLAHRLYDRGLIAGSDGNLSARLADGSILVTPSNVMKADLVEDDLVVVAADGRQVDGRRTPSCELPMHLAIYRMRPDVHAVVHAHPPTAVACSIAGVELDDRSLPELTIFIGPVPTAPFALVGSSELADIVAPFTQRHDAVLLAYHGAIALGTSIAQAFARMDALEHAARILLTARLLGGARPLPHDRIVALDALRVRLGGRSAERRRVEEPADIGLG